MKRKLMIILIAVLLSLVVTVPSFAEEIVTGQHSLFTLDVPADQTVGWDGVEDISHSKEVYYIAYITNVSGEDLSVGYITVSLFDANGEKMDVGMWDYNIGSPYLNDGETTCFTFRCQLYSEEEAAKATLCVHTDEKVKKDEVPGADQMTVRTWYDANEQCAYSSVKNRSMDKLDAFSVANVLEDENGNPLYMNVITRNGVILEPGNTVTTYSKLNNRQTLCRMLNTYFTEHNIQPANVRTFVSREID